MILCVDAAYSVNNAAACGVLFKSIRSRAPEAVHTVVMQGIARYVPGSFYLRELPLILKVVEEMGRVPGLVIVDGYVWLPGNRPGLGAHLYRRLSAPVIGIAKNPFRGHVTHEVVLRGSSRRPLYVTSAGMESGRAAEMVRRMAGRYRLPDMMRSAHMHAQYLLKGSGADLRNG